MPTIEHTPLAIAARCKRLTLKELRGLYILAQWLMLLRAPGKQTAPGEPIDLGEIGTIREKNWSRLSPYSIAQPQTKEF